MNSEIIGKPSDAPTAFLFTYPLKEALEQNGEVEFSKVQFEESGRDTLINGIKHPVMQIVLDLPFKGNPSTLFVSYELVAGILRSQPEREHHFIPMPGIKPILREDGQQIRISLAGVPRHPSQVYEAIYSFILFLLFYFLWEKRRKRVPKGVMFGVFVIIVFTLRFFVEFLKERQELWEEGKTLDMGQWLSIPFVLLGMWMVIDGYRKKEYHHEKSTDIQK
jgi:prolipoprotein diacylglyceryltransferase